MLIQTPSPTPSFALNLSHTYILLVYVQPQRCTGDREASAPEEITSGAGVCSGVYTAGHGEFKPLSEREEREKRGCILSLFLLPLSVYPVCPPHSKSPYTETEPVYSEFR